MSTTDTKVIPVIGIKQVLAMLQDGKDRREIAKHYGINLTECALLFQHEDLKGKKTIKKKEASFTIVADTDIKAVDDSVTKKAEAFKVVDEEEVKVPATPTDDTVGKQDGEANDSKVEKKVEPEAKKEEAKSTWE